MSSRLEKLQEIQLQLQNEAATLQKLSFIFAIVAGSAAAIQVIILLLPYSGINPIQTRSKKRIFFIIILIFALFAIIFYILSSTKGNISNVNTNNTNAINRNTISENNSNTSNELIDISNCQHLLKSREEILSRTNSNTEEQKNNNRELRIIEAKLKRNKCPDRY